VVVGTFKLEGFAEAFDPVTAQWGEAEQLEVRQRGQSFDNIPEALVELWQQHLPLLVIASALACIAGKTQPPPGIYLLYCRFIIDEHNLGNGVPYQVAGVSGQATDKNKKIPVKVNKGCVTELSLISLIQCAEQ
jgi:hypothetical protein